MSQHAKRRSAGVTVIGWLIIASNVFLLLNTYLDVFPFAEEIRSRLTMWAAMLAVYPFDLFHSYLSGLITVRAVWMFLVIFCAFGILLLNKFSRAVFIVLGISHIVTLGYITFLQWGTPDTLEYVFKFYFNMVATGSYIAYLTLPEVREQFHIELEGLRLQVWLQRPLNRKLSRSDGKKYAGLSIAYSRLERYEQAVDAIQKAISTDPDNAHYYFQLGLLHLKLEHPRRAREALHKAIGIDPLHYEAYFNLGQLYLDHGSVREAADMFAKAAHVRPDEVQAYRELADALQACGLNEESLLVFREAVERDPEDSYAYYRMAEICSEVLGDHQRAYPYIQKSVRMQEKCFAAYRLLGKVCYYLGEYKAAVRAFRDALAQGDKDGDIHYYLGMSYAQLGDRTSAVRERDYLIEEEPRLAEELTLLIQSICE